MLICGTFISAVKKLCQNFLKHDKNTKNKVES